MSVDLSELTPAAKEARKARLEEKKALTGRVSENSRYVSFGLLAAFYGLRTASDPFSTKIVGGSRYLLDAMALSAVLAVLSDYLQYYFAARSVEQALKREDQLYPDDTWSFRLRSAFYDAKQILTFLGSIALLVALARSL